MFLKVMKFIKNVIVGILGIIFFAFVLLMSLLLLNYNEYGVTQIENTSLVLIREDLSTGEYKKGDLVIVNSVKFEDVKKGEKLFAYKVAGDKTVTLDLGKVVATHSDERAIEFESGAVYAFKFIAGRAEKTYSNVGNYLAIIQSKWGFLFIILVPSFMIFIYEIYALIVEIKYGAEDEQIITKEEPEEVEVDEDFKDIKQKKVRVKKVVTKREKETFKEENPEVKEEVVEEAKTTRKKKTEK